MTTDTDTDTDEGRRNVRRQLAALAYFKDIDSDLQLQALLTFYWIALNEGKQQRDLCRDLDIKVSSASRNIATLSTLPRPAKPTIGLVTWVDDPQDRRAKQLMLTPKGRSLYQKLSLL